ncbi:MAG: C10 family peptidase, partial [Paludibacteraceae bacterium]|nr:C10 family peptidase [Paludibacteraceae bacterium]
MKRYFLLLTVLSFAFVFEAKEVSYDEALQTASEFFAPASSSKKQVKALKSNLSLATTFNQTINSEKPAFYIINNGENGFVIVSADNNATQILGYSDKGAFDAENIPSNVKFWLDRYAEEISYVAKNNIKQPLYANSVTYDAVAPLLGKIEHTQLKPYNDSCPKIDGKETPTGCVATAGGQIMTYWKHHKQGKGNVSYTTSTHNLPLSADLSKSTYDWANIKDKYVRYPQNYNDQQAKAVAVLLRDIGYAVQMNYMTTGSASSDQDMAMAFVNHFGYDKSLHRKSFDQTIGGETWYWQSKEDLLYDLCDELKAGRPVYCAGMSPTKNEGHVFVCDGIQSDGKLHINWGWDGDKNGYFEVTSFNPGGGGEGAGDGIYTRGIAFITHIQPDKGTTEMSQSWGVRYLNYVPTTNEFSKTDDKEFTLFIDEKTGYKYVCNLNPFPATIYFGYSIFKKTDCISATYARWGANFGTEDEYYLDGNGEQVSSKPIEVNSSFRHQYFAI